MSVFMTADATSSSVQYRRQVHVDAVCLKFEDAWQHGQLPDVKTYWLMGAPEDRGDLLTALIEIDLVYRRRRGEAPQPEDYLRQFPEEAEAIAAAFRRDQHVCFFSEPLEPGMTLGRYRLIRSLGQGSFGVVYLAEDTELQRLVALKFPGNGQVASGEQVARLMEEIRAAAQLRHPGIVAIYDVQRLSSTKLFAVMEYVEGQTLRRYAARRHPYARWAELFAQMADAVHYAHSRGFIHRDLDPDNVLIDVHGHARITDFGLAVHEDQQGTRVGERAGSWAYMSPEQVRGESHRLDGRSDIWSLGVLLYECLTGRRPFQGKNRAELIASILEDEPPPIQKIRRDVPYELAQICLRCLRKLPDERWQSGADLAAALRKTAVLLYRYPTRRQLLWWLPAAATVTGSAAVLGWAAFGLPRSVELHADLLVWRHRAWYSVQLPWILPLREGDCIQVRLTCRPAHYVYLFWFDSQRTIQPLFPWKDGNWTQRAVERRVSRLKIPLGSEDAVWSMHVPSPGHELLMITSRPTPLPHRLDIHRLLKDLPSWNSSSPTACILTYHDMKVLSPHRGFDPQHTLRTGDPMLSFQQVLRERLSPYFSTLQCMVLPCVP